MSRHPPASLLSRRRRGRIRETAHPALIALPARTRRARTTRPAQRVTACSSRRPCRVASNVTRAPSGSVRFDRRGHWASRPARECPAGRSARAAGDGTRTGTAHRRARRARETARQHALDRFELARRRQLRQHAVDARHGFVDVLDEQDGVARVDLVARALHGADQRQVAARQPAGGRAGHQRRRQGIVRRADPGALPHPAADHGVEGGLGGFLAPVQQILRQHRAMEGHEARMALDGQMQRRDVAIANEGLGVAAQQFVVQQVQQAPGAETALQAPDGIDIGGSEGRVQVGARSASVPAR